MSDTNLNAKEDRIGMTIFSGNMPFDTEWLVWSYPVWAETIQISVPNVSTEGLLEQKPERFFKTKIPKQSDMDINK